MWGDEFLWGSNDATTEAAKGIGNKTKKRSGGQKKRTSRIWVGGTSEAGGNAYLMRLEGPL
jgi:hypothetical protein